MTLHASAFLDFQNVVRVIQALISLNHDRDFFIFPGGYIQGY